MKIIYLAPAVLTITFALYSEKFGGTISTIRDYVLSNPNELTTGVITESKINRYLKRWQKGYDIGYEYSVNNIIYIGHQINYSDKRTDPEKMIQKYPLGTKVTVYYDARLPKYSTLEKSTLDVSVYREIGGFIFCYIFFAWLTYWTEKD